MAFLAHHHGGTNQDPSSFGHRPRLDHEEDTHKWLDPKRQILVNICRDNTRTNTVDDNLPGRHNACEALDKSIDDEFAVLIPFPRDVFLGVVKMGNDRFLCSNGVGLQRVMDVAI